MDNSLVLMDVQKTFPGFSLRDVSFSLPRGFVMGFIGPNGAGKTTVIKLILNMLVRDSGSIRVFDQDNLLAEQEIKERIGIVMDETFYVDAWTLKDVGMALKPFYRKWSGERYAALLRKFDLDPAKKVKDLSRGMKMKLMIAAALSHESDLLIFDEPTSGLDAVARSELMEIVRDYMAGRYEKRVIFHAYHHRFGKDRGLYHRDQSWGHPLQRHEGRAAGKIQAHPWRAGDAGYAPTGADHRLPGAQRGV